jgi:hypothetical protein
LTKNTYRREKENSVIKRGKENLHPYDFNLNKLEEYDETFEMYLSDKEAKEFREKQQALRNVIVKFLKENKCPPFIAKGAINNLGVDVEAKDWIKNL